MRAAVAGLAAALATLAAPARVKALTVTMTPATPTLAGHAVTLRVASVTQNVGAPSFTWNFGDGSPATVGTDAQVTHTYQSVGHYTVIVLASDEAGRTSASFVQTIYATATARPPSNSSSIILDAERHRVWTVNSDSDSVSVIDADQLTRVREVAVGDEPHALAQAQDGTVWVTNQKSDEVLVLDRASAEVRARIALPYASQPHGIAFGPGGMAYVALYGTGELVEIDATTHKLGRRLALGPTPYGVSAAADGRIFVTRFISPQDHGEVWVVRPDGFTLKKTITLAFDLGPDTQSSGRGVPNYVSAAIISPDGTQAWVTAKKDDVARGKQRDGLPMTADNFVRPAVCAIDLRTESEVLEKRQDIDNRATPVSVAFSPLGDYAFILVQPSNWIGIMDGFTAQGLSGIKEVGNAPDGLVLAANGRLFVNAFLSREVIVYDVSLSLSSADHGAPQPMARIPTIDREPLSASVLLGKKIFYNAADTRMGHAGYWACASCHFGGFSDGRVWDFTDRGEGLRNTKSLLGIRGAQGEGRVHWSANFDEIQDFERDIRESFLGSGFMSDAEYNARMGANGIYDSLGKPAAGASAELDGLAAYVTSLDKVPRSPYRNPDGTFTAAALAGRKIFERAGCPECHSGPDFTDSPQGVVHDVGTIRATSGMRLSGPLTGIDTPSLKGLWQSAPYLHDGRAATIKEIFTTYITDDKMGKTSDLGATELDQLVEYLQELDDVPEAAPPAAPGNANMDGGCACRVERHAGGATAGDEGLLALAGGLLSSWARRRRRRCAPAPARLVPGHQMCGDDFSHGSWWR